MNEKQTIVAPVITGPSDAPSCQRGVVENGVPLPSPAMSCRHVRNTKTTMRRIENMTSMPLSREVLLMLNSTSAVIMRTTNTTHTAGGTSGKNASR